MFFENCSIHQKISKDVMVACKGGTFLFCHTCLKHRNSLDLESQLGVSVNKKTMIFFYKWNQYLTEELNFILQIIQKEGFKFIFEAQLNDSLKNDPAAIQKGQIELSRIVTEEISQHIDLLKSNMKILSGKNKQSLLSSPMFLKDLHTVITQNVSHTIEPVRLSILDSVSSDWIDIQWKHQIIECLEKMRNIIVKDWVGESIIFLKKDRQSADTMDTDGVLEKYVDDYTCNQFQISAQKNESVCSETQGVSVNSQLTQGSVQMEVFQIQSIKQIKMQNLKLREKLQLSHIHILYLEQRLKQMQQNYEEKLQEQRVTYEQDIQQILQDTTEKVIMIQQSLNLVCVQFQTLQKQHFQHTCMIEQLQKERTSLKEINIQLDKELSKTTQDNQLLTKSYYLSHKQENSTSSIDEQLLESVVEMQATIMQKQTDIALLIDCLRQVTHWVLDKGRQGNPLAFMRNVEKKARRIENNHFTLIDV